MKKPAKKPLTLATETLRPLHERALEQVAGGKPTSTASACHITPGCTIPSP